MNAKKSTKKAYRVLMVTGIYPTEERPHAGTFIKSQADSLVEAGLEVEIIHPKPGPVLLRYATAAIQVFLKTRQGDFDIVHGHYGLWVLAGCMQWTTPIVASFLGDDLLGTPTGNGGFSKKSKLVIHISRWLCRRAKAVIVKSEEMRQATFMEKNIFVIPNGVDFALFRPGPRSDARTALGWKQDAFYVLFGNDPQIPRKNFALAQAAIKCLRARGISAELVVANGLPQTQVVQYINACNVPVVATDVGDVSEVIGHTKGCNVCPFEPEALATALEEAIRHTEPTTGRNDIRHLDRSVVAQQVIEVYESVLQGVGQGGSRGEEVYAKSVQGTHAGGEFAGTGRSSRLGRGDGPA